MIVTSGLQPWNRRWESLDRNQIQELVDVPKDSKVIGCRWVFRKKDNEQCKARLVAKGYAQIEGIDYNEIFSLVVKHTSTQVLLTIVAHFDLELEQLDVKTIFLHGELEERIYMKQPKGYIQEGQENNVCLLKKSLWLKQSLRQWYKQFDSFMIKTRYTRCEYDSCVYFK